MKVQFENLRESSNLISVEDTEEKKEYVSQANKPNNLFIEDKDNIRIYSGIKEYDNGIINNNFELIDGLYVNDTNVFKTTIQDDNSLLISDGTYFIQISLDGCDLCEKTLNSNEIIVTEVRKAADLSYVLNENYLTINTLVSDISESDSCKNYKYTISSNLVMEKTKNGLLFYNETKDVEYLLDWVGRYNGYDNEGEYTIGLDKTGDNYVLNIIIDNLKNNKISCNLALQIRKVLKPIIELESKYNNGIIFDDNKNILVGYSSNDLYQCNIKIDTEELINTIYNYQYEDYKIMLLLNYIREFNSVDNLMIKHNNVVIFSSKLNEEDCQLKVDITDIIKSKLKNYMINETDISDTVLEMRLFVNNSSDASLAHNYIIIKDVRSNYEERPSILIQKDYKIKENNYLKLNILDNSNLEFSMNDKTIKNDIELDMLKSGNIELPFSLYYDDDKKDELNSIGKGWKFNINQRLEKINNSKNAFKKILYTDGKNVKHEFIQKWYYIKDDVKHYVLEDSIYLDNDNKYKFRNKNNEVFETEYEMINDDDYKYYSLVDNIKQKDYINNYKNKYYLEYKDGSREELQMYDDYLIEVPIFFIDENFEIPNNELNLLNYKIFDEFKDKIKAYSFKNCVKIEDGVCYDEDENELYAHMVRLPLLFKNGKYYVKNIKNLILINDKDYYFTYIDEESENVLCCEYYEDDIEIKVERYYFDNVEETSDIYETEDLKSIIDQIESVENYITSLENQIESISKNINQYENEYLNQKTLNKFNDEITLLSDAILESSWYEGSEVEYNGAYFSYKNGIIYRDKLNSILSKDSQNYNNSVITNQIKDFPNQLTKLLKEYDKYNIMLLNLNEKKEYYLEKAKNEIHDVIVDKNNIYYGFDYSGKLVYIFNENEDEILINYEKELISKIESKNNSINFYYNENKTVDYICNSRGDIHRFIYEDNNLSKIEFSDEDEYIFFLYDENNLLKLIRNKYNSINIERTDDNSYNIIKTTYINNITTEQILTGLPYVEICKQIGFNNNNIEVNDLITKTKTKYYLNKYGQLIYQNTKDLNQLTSQYYKPKEVCLYKHYDNNNLKYNVEVDIINHELEILLENIDYNYLNEIIYFNNENETYNINLYNDKYILGLMLNNAQSILENNNKISISLNVFDKNNDLRTYEYTYYNDSEKIIVPIPIFKTDIKMEYSILFDTSINGSILSSLDFYKSNASIYDYDDEDKLVRYEDNESIKTYSNYVNDKPTKTISVDNKNKETIVLTDTMTKVI